MVSRRIFLKDSAFALVSFGFASSIAPTFLARTAFAAGGARRPKQLVAIFQRGAVDGLSMIVPYEESDYYRSRPSIAVPRPNAGPDGALDLDGFFGLNPRLLPLQPFWNRRELAVVHACGSPNATRSHFDAQDFMESATPGVKSTRDGWLNRYLQARPAAADPSPFQAVSLTGQLPRSLQGRASALALNRVGDFGIRDRDTAIGQGFEAQYAAAADLVLGGVGRETFQAMRRLKDADPASYQPAHGAEYPRSPFGEALRQIAQLSKADLGLEVAFAETGGWDTHVNQGATRGQLATRLDDLARGVAALATDLGERMADTVIVTMSEFGRAVRENGNRGTDHGHGNVMMILGGGVHGGRVYGRWPGLDRESLFEGRDLAITTDFRDVLGEIVVRHLAVPDPAPVFPGYELTVSRFPGLLG
jgi:uncharacterized protein (DUF1501 family)